MARRSAFISTLIGWAGCKGNVNAKISIHNHYTNTTQTLHNQLNVLLIILLLLTHQLRLYLGPLLDLDLHPHAVPGCEVVA